MVLKVANATEERAILEAQQRAITHLAPRLDITPRVLSTVNGRALAEAIGAGRQDALRLGDHLARRHAHGRRAAPLAGSSIEDLGRQIGALQREFADFDHPRFHRDFYWDLANARAIVDIEARARRPTRRSAPRSTA